MSEKTITSHRFRVTMAKNEIERRNERISIFDREAFVETYLLEDIIRLYENRLKREMARNPETEMGRKARQMNIEKFTSIITIFKSAVEVARGQIDSGNYSVVWRSINEHALMMAAGSAKNLPQLRKLGTKLLRDIIDEALQAHSEVVAQHEDYEDAVMHEENVRKVLGLPSEAEIDAIIHAAEVAIPSDKKSRTGKSILE